MSTCFGTIPYEKEAFLALIETWQPHRYEWRDGMLYALPGRTGPHSDLADRPGELFRPNSDLGTANLYQMIE